MSSTTVFTVSQLQRQTQQNVLKSSAQASLSQSDWVGAQNKKAVVRRCYCDNGVCQDVGRGGWNGTYYCAKLFLDAMQCRD